MSPARIFTYYSFQFAYIFQPLFQFVPAFQFSFFRFSKYGRSSSQVVTVKSVLKNFLSGFAIGANATLLIIMIFYFIFFKEVLRVQLRKLLAKHNNDAIHELDLYFIYKINLCYQITTNIGLLIFIIIIIYCEPLDIHHTA